jgi:hypothetical protein
MFMARIRMQFDNQWDRLLSVPAWTPIVDFPFHVSPVEGKLYSLNESAFLIAVDYNADLVRSAVPLVTMVIWAVDTGVARRFALMQIERDSGLPAVAPPPEIVSPPATYQSILDRFDSRPGDRVILSAEYRVAKDGAPIGGYIRHGGRECCFRSVNPRKDEPVVAVRIRLRKHT